MNEPLVTDNRDSMKPAVDRGSRRVRGAEGASVGRVALLALLLAAGGCGRWPRTRFAPPPCSSPASAALSALGRILDGDRCACAYAPAQAPSSDDLPRRIDGTDEPQEYPPSP